MSANLSSLPAAAFSAASLPAAAPADLPAMFSVRQRLPRPRVGDLREAVETALDAAQIPARVRPGARVAITAGSRGISDLPPILAAAAGRLRDLGAEPFIVAAMGSHGGGTVAGQGAVLAELGVTPEAVGAPVVVTEEAVVLGTTPSGQPVYCDREAAAADGILVVNRVKPHTAFRGAHESGLLKMLAVGLGKRYGAEAVHRRGPAGMEAGIVEAARIILGTGKVVGGLGIVENAYEETAILEGFAPEEIEAGEARLLKAARDLLPGLPAGEIDLLIVEEMGKNYSGTGMDTNVIGRWRIQGVPEPEHPRVTRLVVLRLSEQSRGNATGIGLADFTTRRLVEATDWPATYLNCLTSTFVNRAMCPIALPSEREAILVALGSANLPDRRKARIMRVANTLHLETVQVSEALLPALAGRPGVEVAPEAERLRFDGEGKLLPAAALGHA